MPDPQLLFAYCCARLGIDPHDLEQLRGAGDVAVLARHALAREHATRETNEG